MRGKKRSAWQVEICWSRVLSVACGVVHADLSALDVDDGFFVPSEGLGECFLASDPRFLPGCP